MPQDIADAPGGSISINNRIMGVLLHECAQVVTACVHCMQHSEVVCSHISVVLLFTCESVFSVVYLHQIVIQKGCIMQFDMQSLTAIVIGALAIWLVWKLISGIVRLITVLTIVAVVVMMMMRVL